MQLKVVRNSRNISCFVEFDTVANAMQCHTTQQVRNCIATSAWAHQGSSWLQVAGNSVGQ